METKTTTKKLASALILASLMLNLTSPSSQGAAFVTAHARELDVNELTNDSVFTQPQNIDKSMQNLLVGETSFLALKSPPVAKQVVISKMWLFVTAYSSTKDQTDSTPFITAANTHVRDGVVAANFLSFGAKMRFPTIFQNKIFIVEDRMNSRYPYRIDIWMPSREQAIDFGVKILPIEIIKEIYPVATG